MCPVAVFDAKGWLLYLKAFSRVAAFKIGECSVLGRRRGHWGCGGEPGCVVRLLRGTHVRGIRTDYRGEFQPSWGTCAEYRCAPAVDGGLNVMVRRKRRHLLVGRRRGH